MAKIELLWENRTITAQPGETLLEALRRAGLGLDAPCGGKGKCGKCKVQLEDGSWVLACQTRVETDLRLKALPQREVENRILTGASIAQQKASDPVVRQLRVQVPPCPMGESSSDWTRFAREIEKTTVGRKPVVSPDAASRIGQIRSRTGGEVTAILLDVPGQPLRVLSVSDREQPCHLAAFDVGTTTVAAYLLESGSGEVRATASCMNPQAQYGADVISRANYAREHGYEELASCIHEAVNQLLSQMAREAGIGVEDIYAVSVAGNTCMHHLFLGISVDSLVLVPYNPTLSEPAVLLARDYGIRVHGAAPLLMLPNIAGFVGADTTACLVSTRLAEQKEWTLLIDIGTNGEMVLGRDHDLIACSTAAGPAFEGAGISCGMRGAEGAVSKVTREGETLHFEVIGGGKVRGICGSGLLDLAAMLLESGQMDESGRLTRGDRVVLATGEESATGEEISVSQKDIRSLQLAKAAIAAGVRLLAGKKQIDISQISQVWLAGAFGSFLSPESACTIGLIPPELRGRIRGIGNAAGEGAKDVLRGRSDWDYAAQVAGASDFLELATMPAFQDMFVDELEFPA